MGRKVDPRGLIHINIKITKEQDDFIENVIKESLKKPVRPWDRSSLIRHLTQIAMQHTDFDELLGGKVKNA